MQIQGGILMAVQLFGNINGSYQPPNIDLFELTGKQNNQPLTYRDMEAVENAPAIKVNISKEGLRALHGSKLNGSADIKKAVDDIRYISEHQPVESFTNRFAKLVPISLVQEVDKPSDDTEIQKKGQLLTNEFKKICNEITDGYNVGNRIRSIEDSTTEDGYRRLSKDDELSILLKEFRAFVENRFGEEHQDVAWKTANAMNNIQKEKQEMGHVDTVYYKPEYVPADFIDKLINAATQYVRNIKQ